MNTLFFLNSTLKFLFKKFLKSHSWSNILSHLLNWLLFNRRFFLLIRSHTTFELLLLNLSNLRHKCSFLCSSSLFPSDFVLFELKCLLVNILSKQVIGELNVHINFTSTHEDIFIVALSHVNKLSLSAFHHRFWHSFDN